MVEAAGAAAQSEAADVACGQCLGDGPERLEILWRFEAGLPEQIPPACAARSYAILHDYARLVADMGLRI
jgi:hypothetical protein